MTRFILTAAAFVAIAACNDPNNDYANRDVPGTPTTVTTTPARTNPPTVTTNTNPQITATAPAVDVHDNGTADARKLDEQSFHHQFAAAWCEKQKSCDSKGFEGWRDMNDCVDRKSDQATFSGDWKEMTCGGYRSESVQTCIDAMNASQCDDWNNKEWKNECAKVYGCNS